MIIVANKSGQLANRLFLFGHLIAFALENRGTIVNPTLEEYADFFPATRRDLLCKYPPPVAPLPAGAAARRKAFDLMVLWRNRIITRKPLPQHIGFMEVSSDEVCHLDRETFQRMARKKLLLLAGWNYRSYAAFDKHADTIRRIFQPTDAIKANVSRLLAEARRDGDVLIGIHIRRGDYKEHRGGRFYFDWTQYADAMRSAEVLFAGRSVRFLLCSNVPVETEAFAEFRFTLGSGHIAEDLSAFVGCDYLLGPPSTYTMWASFMGQVPLYQMFEADAAFSLADFRCSGGNCDTPDDIERWVEWREPTPEEQNVSEKQAL